MNRIVAEPVPVTGKSSPGYISILYGMILLLGLIDNRLTPFRPFR